MIGTLDLEAEDLPEVVQVVREDSGKTNAGLGPHAFLFFKNLHYFSVVTHALFVALLLFQE